MIDAILNLLFPQMCVLCATPVLERRWSVACPECWAKLEPVPRPFCLQCGMPAPAIETLCGACRRGDHAFDFARSLYVFNDPMRGIIHHLKYSARVSLAKTLGPQLRECIARGGFQSKVVLPVPLHRARARQRGYNQAELLAAQVGLEVNSKLLRRRKNTPSQTGLSRSQRTLNLSAAFEVRGRPPETVLVIDDVYTTGSTLHEISRTLKRAGVLRVEVLTVARVLQPMAAEVRVVEVQ
jgi:ComF family protein